MVEQRGIVNFLDAQIDAFHINDNSRSLFYLSIAFDASISDIGTALLSGAALVIEDDSTLRDGKKLVAALQEKHITHMDVPPSLLGILSIDDMPESLETIIIGGEVCPPDTVRAWARRFRVINVYGPTETTVCTSLIACDADDWGKPLIGTPFPNVTYIIEDDELLIGGMQLARGYLNRDDLNTEKFVLRGTERFYKTGDKVQRDDNGQIVFLGRNDRQFKLRGQLVAPEEIEAQLREHPQVTKAAVLKRPLYDGGAEALVAFIEGAAEDDLQTHLAQKLPKWMLPQHIACLPQIPETVTGKSDFAQLRTLDLQVAPIATTLPETAQEKTLHNIWAAILKKSDFGIDDDFFAIGGDSLAVIHLSLAAEKQDLRISPALLVQYPTIRKLAEALDARADDSGALPCDWLKRDVAFDTNWQTLINAAAKRPQNETTKPAKIFLTGATGFLGGRLLSELLAQTSAEIVCLVRDPSRMSIKDSRITTVSGDLEQPYFGLPANVWQELADGIDTVYHCAARVNVVQPYEVLRTANVAGTREVLRVALTGKRKKLHIASTLSVFVATDQNSGTLLESDRLENTKYVYGGYAQTKWAAEYMLLQVPKAACDITHYRFGLITGDSETGSCSETDFLKIFARGIRSLGAVPEGFGEKLLIDITPVDYAAAAMAHLSLHGAEEIYHIAGSGALSLKKLTAAIGNIREMPAQQWQQSFQNKDMTTEESAAYLALCRCLDDFDRYRTMDLFQATGVTFDTAHCTRDYGTACPPPSDALIRLYLDHIFASPAHHRRTA
ncbi:MAG: NAD-dependent epimerase/dehydratase family protein [Alphaproteobacteria bacterium]|nr:MAG: NAD-dependent epimerase/dehydratase family protein [Alphaproteobacteria bacterium]